MNLIEQTLDVAAVNSYVVVLIFHCFSISMCYGYLSILFVGGRWVGLLGKKELVALLKIICLLLCDCQCSVSLPHSVVGWLISVGLSKLQIILKSNLKFKGFLTSSVSTNVFSIAS